MENKDIKLDISESSKDDSSRKELLWEKREEDVFYEWLKDMNEKSTAHGKKGKIFKKRYAILMIPATLIPIIISGLSSVLVAHPLIISGAGILTGVLSGLSGFYNLGSKYEQHFQYENHYAILAKEIRKELSKPKAMRPACDVYLEKIMAQLNNLDSNAPLL